jgi:hypothetical protein
VGLIFTTIILYLMIFKLFYMAELPENKAMVRTHDVDTIRAPCWLAVLINGISGMG